jgi:hypothetical protein
LPTTDARAGRPVQLHRRCLFAGHPRRGGVIRHLGDDVTVVYAAVRRGRHLAVPLAEAADADNDWDVLSARDLSDSETKKFLDLAQQ